MKQFDFNMEESLTETLEFMPNDMLGKFYATMCKNYRSACVEYTVASLNNKATTHLENKVARYDHLANTAEAVILKRGVTIEEDIF